MLGNTYLVLTMGLNLNFSLTFRCIYIVPINWSSLTTMTTLTSLCNHALSNIYIIYRKPTTNTTIMLRYYTKSLKHKLVLFEGLAKGIRIEQKSNIKKQWLIKLKLSFYRVLYTGIPKSAEESCFTILLQLYNFKMQELDMCACACACMCARARAFRNINLCLRIRVICCTPWTIIIGKSAAICLELIFFFEVLFLLFKKNEIKSTFNILRPNVYL